MQRVWRGHVGRCIAAERAKEMVAFVRYLHRKELLEAEVREGEGLVRYPRPLSDAVLLNLHQHNRHCLMPPCCSQNDFYRTHTLERWKRDWRRWRHGPATAKTATRSDVCVIQ